MALGSEYGEEKCDIVGCNNKPVKTMSIAKISSIGLKLKLEKRHARICKEHYKEYKKKTKKERIAERLAWR